MAEKTEAPTGRRLSEARKKGQVVRSTELNSAAILVISMLLLQSIGKQLVENVKILIITSLSTISDAEMNIAFIRHTLYSDFITVFPNVAMIMVVLLGTGVAVTFAQTNFLWASDRIKFDFGKLNPLSGLQRIFSTRGLFEMGKALLKLALVGYVAYGFIRDRIQDMLMLSQYDFVTGLSNWVKMAVDLGLRIGGAYLLLAIADYIYQRYTFMKNLKMTKEEVKEEMIQQEGNPLIKSRIRGQMRRMARLRMMAAVPKASVVITNPTHLAVAIEYDPSRMKAPRVVAKGAHLVAFKIVDIAKANHIPVIQNIPVARGLYKAVDIDQEIPPEFYKVIAEILAYVYRLRGQVRMPSAA
jgi:flagellar biosynthetic protein FlhB